MKKPFRELLGRKPPPFEGFLGDGGLERARYAKNPRYDGMLGIATLRLPTESLTAQTFAKAYRAATVALRPGATERCLNTRTSVFL
ncbi:MAG: hypothetical protein WBW33_00125 [Bryobacteraceae bacterium]